MHTALLSVPFDLDNCGTRAAVLFHHEVTVARVVKQLTGGGSADRHVAAFLQLYRRRELALPPDTEGCQHCVFLINIMKHLKNHNASQHDNVCPVLCLK